MKEELIQLNLKVVEFQLLKRLATSKTRKELVATGASSGGRLSGYLKSLQDKKLITENEDLFKLTQKGKYIVESFETFQDLQQFIIQIHIEEKLEPLPEEQTKDISSYIEGYLNAVAGNRGVERSEAAQNILQELECISKKIQEYNQLRKQKLNTKNFGLHSVINYCNKFAGFSRELGFYPNLTAMISLSQQIAVTGFEIKLPGNRKLLSTFHQANLGLAQTGKSWNTRALLLGKIDKGIEPVGTPLIRNGIEGMRAPAFVVFLYLHEALPNFKFLYLNDEFSDWIKREKELQNKLKAVLEFENVSWKLKSKISVPEFITKGAFILNCNDKYKREHGINSVNPDVAAILSRTTVQGWQNTKEVSRFIRNRKMNITKTEARDLRIFNCKLYDALTENKLTVKWDKKDYQRFDEMIDLYEDALQSIAGTTDFDLEFGIREKETAIKFASALTVFDYFKDGKLKVIKPKAVAIDLGLHMLLQQLLARQPTVRDKHHNHKPMNMFDVINLLEKLNLKPIHKLF